MRAREGHGVSLFFFFFLGRPNGGCGWLKSLVFSREFIVGLGGEGGMKGEQGEHSRMRNSLR